jgi:hypothetical protein
MNFFFREFSHTFVIKIRAMKTITIGRSDNNHIVLSDPSERVSRLHAKISVNSNGRISIIDLSSNGTWINGVRMEKGKEYPINRGDHVRFANLFDLDWRVLDMRLMSTGKPNPTVFVNDMKEIIDAVTDYSGLGSNYKLFSRCLKGYSNILNLSNDASITKQTTISYFTFGVVIAVIAFSKSEASNVVMQANPFPGASVGADKFDWFYEILLCSLLALLTFLFAVVNYKTFKWLSGSKKRWSSYSTVYFHTAGTFFWLVAMAMAPGLLLHLVFETVQIQSLIFALESLFLPIILGWGVFTWLKVNLNFWD